MKATINNLALSATGKIGSGYENNLNAVLANHCREEYMRLYKQWDALNKMNIVGVREVTLKSDTDTITIALVGDGGRGKGGMIYTELAELIGERLTTREHEIERHEQDSHKEEAQEREGLGPRAEALGFCLPMRPLSDEEFLSLPAEARRAYDDAAAAKLEAA